MPTFFVRAVNIQQPLSLIKNGANLHCRLFIHDIKGRYIQGLAWFHGSINQAPAQRYFECEQQDTNIMAVNKVNLAGWEIDVPILEVQSKMMDLVTMQEQEVGL